MADDLDIKQVIEKGTRKTTLKDLAERGFEKVKVLDENAVQDLITRAVDRVVTTQTAEERSKILAESRRELDRLLKEQRAIRSRAQLLESDKHELIEQVESLQRELQLKGELEEETLQRRLEQGLASLQAQVEELRSRGQQAVRDLEAAREEAAEARATRERSLAELGELQKEIGRLTADRDRVEQEAEATLAKLGALEKELAEERSRERGAERARADLVAQILKLQGGLAAAGAERGRLEREGAARADELGRLQSEKAGLEDRLREAEKRVEAAGHAEAELRTRLAGTEALRETAQRELETVRQEAAFLRGQLAQQQKDADTQRERTVLVTAELQEIEEQQKSERDELERLRADAARLAEERERLGRDLETGRGEIEALQDLLRREQEAARSAQNESVSLQARHQDLLVRSAELERELERLREGQLRAAEVARLSQLLERAERTSSAARAAALRSRETAAELERTLARQHRPKSHSRGRSLRDGAAYDGMALLEGFFRRIRLKERFQKHLPVRETPGRPHPSEMMVETLKAIVAGEPRAPEGRKAFPLEVVGAPGAPDAPTLRQFLGGLSPQAVRALAQVHHGLRLHLSALPRRPHPLVLDVTALDVGPRGGGRRACRPLVCFDPAAGEFWNGRFRSGRGPAAAGILPFLRTCLSRVPASLARGRIRFRLDPRFFNESVVRFLDSKGVAYVIPAPDTAAVRKAARRCAFTRLSNGWEVGEFLLRLHPIRRTQGRFVVLRRRRSKAARAAGRGLFSDDRHLYHVFATDRKGTPWRSFEFYAARPASLEKARGLLSEFTTSRLRGRSRRSVAALFQAHLLASDLLQAFRRGCLPSDARTLGIETLRDDFVWAPSREAGRRLVVLPRRDRRRTLFARVARLTRRLRPAHPFSSEAIGHRP